MADKPGGILATTKDLITRTKGLDDIYDDLAKVPKSDGSVSFNSTALGAINAEVDNALDTAIPATNTADSVNDILLDKLKPRLPSSGTLATTDDLSGGGLSAKEKALMGVMGYPPLNEWFLDVAHAAAPNTDVWNVYTSNGTAQVYHVAPSYLKLFSEGSNTASVFTKGKWQCSRKYPYTALYCEFYFLPVPVSSMKQGIGLIYSTQTNPTHTHFEAGADNQCCLYASRSDNSGNWYFHTSQGSTTETTDLSTNLVWDSWNHILMTLTASSTTLHVNGTLRATHSVQIPNVVWQFAATTYGSTMNIQYVRAWMEE